MIKRKSLYKSWYHGTSRNDAKFIMNNSIDVTCSGGELGQGFYMGNFLHEAKAWAFQKNKKHNAKSSIVVFNVKPWISFKYGYIGTKRAIKIYKKSKNQNNHRAYLYNYDLVHSKVIGIDRYNFEQLKWETTKGENYLNNTIFKQLI